MNNNASQDAANIYVNYYLQVSKNTITNNYSDGDNDNKNNRVSQISNSVVRLCNAMFVKGKYRILLNFFTCLVASIHAGNFCNND